MGGWLVLERWMTPALFADTNARDEYEFMQTSGAVDKLRQHQKTFIQEEDFRWLSKHGITSVRIPIGYWALEGDVPYRSCIGRLDWAVRMAQKYHLTILISLHGAPGSQNGMDHSGRIGVASWYGSATHQERTIEILTTLAKRYYDQSAVWGIELLNEPLAWRHVRQLRKFYRQAYAALKAVARPGFVTVFSDAFMPRLMSGTIHATTSHPVMMDTHWYHFITPRFLQRRLPLWPYTWVLKARRSMLARLSKDQPIIIGEWSGVIGWEALQRLPTAEHEATMRAHIKQQLAVFSEVAGWFYWTYKTDGDGIWNFRSLVEEGQDFWLDSR